jgi:hypothetical protein
MVITSREYKIILDHGLFADLADGFELLLDDIKGAAKSADVTIRRTFDTNDPKERTVLFLDTPDCTLRANELLFRQRVRQKSRKTEYTLKCRTEDRYVAAGRNVLPAEGLEHEHKFEEDIGVPFVSRFSHSATVELKRDHELAGENFPRTLAAAARLFPALLKTQHDGLPCTPTTALAPVNDRKVRERVFSGVEIELDSRVAGEHATTGEIAVILWTHIVHKRFLAAELSFRYENSTETYSAGAAFRARRFFELLQDQEWARPDSLTKTQLMYGES